GPERRALSRAADHRGVMHRPIHELTDAYRRGDLTPTTVAEDYLARIGALDGKVGAYLTVMREQALAAARESELRWRAGSPGRPARAARRCADRGQGRHVHGRREDDGRVEDARALRAALRRDDRRAAAGRRGGGPGQDQSG